MYYVCYHVIVKKAQIYLPLSQKISSCFTQKRLKPLALWNLSSKTKLLRDLGQWAPSPPCCKKFSYNTEECATTTIIIAQARILAQVTQFRVVSASKLINKEILWSLSGYEADILLPLIGLHHDGKQTFRLCYLTLPKGIIKFGAGELLYQELNNSQGSFIRPGSMIRRWMR